jgi:SAM-dependent methyltransferase
MDKVKAHVFVDFGCADGSMIRLLSQLFPDNFYIGYDYDKDMISRAKSIGESKNLRFFYDWNKVSSFIGDKREEFRSIFGEPNGNGYSCSFDMKICLLLFSVIHEVYSYGPENISKFWEIVFGNQKNVNERIIFNTIVIRDMSVSKKASRQSDPIAVARIRQIFDSYKINQWESQWGSLDENWSLVHFLLTYHYEDNWEREYKENYLPIPMEDLLPKFPVHYFPKHIEHYTLPYIREKVQKDFGIQLQERTHLKLIMERS